jgi:pimeloyl-ACP methyl ester carboxylesterase
MATEILIIPIAGAGNYGKKRVSTAKFHFPLLSRSLQHIESSRVTDPVIPPKFGIFGSLDGIYEDVATEVLSLSDLEPGVKRIVVGHSLGGLLGRRMLGEGIIDGLVTLGAPHAGLSRFSIPLIPPATRREYERFADAIPDNAARGSLSLIGSRYDGLVPLESSLADLKNAIRHEFRGATTHNLMPLTSGIVSVSTRMVQNMVDRMPETVARPVDRALSEPA